MQPKEQNALVTLEDKAQQLDAAAEKFGKQLEISNTPFSSALALSKGVQSLRNLLDDGIMREIMELADTPLGFMTDRSPSAVSAGKVSAYEIDEVRDAIIEASLRGYNVVGNEFNIISGRFYGAKAGLYRKVITYEGVTDFKEFLGVPRLSGDRGAVVTAKATWNKGGIKCELERDFAIRVNAGMGVDAILGKAQRKLYASVLNRLTGKITPEGDIDDAVLTAKPVIQVPTGPQSDVRKPDQFVTADTPEPKDANERAAFGIARLQALMARDNISLEALLSILVERLLPIGEAGESGDLADLPAETIKTVAAQWDVVVSQAPKEKKGNSDVVKPKFGGEEADFLSGLEQREPARAKK